MLKFIMPPPVAPLRRESDEEGWLVSRLVAPLWQCWFAAMAAGDINRLWVAEEVLLALSCPESHLGAIDLE